MIYVILGQTASGKTSLALSLARKYHLPIISADAYQCYKMMQIGTDKPKKEDIDGIDYHFYDEYDPTYVMNVVTFQKEGRKVLSDYIKKGKDVIVCGGTFLYVKALLFNYVFYQEDIDHSLDNLSLEELQKMLLDLDPSLYFKIDNQNSRRIKRALLQLKNGHSKDDILALNDNRPLYPCRFFSLEIDKEEGNSKIDKRIDKMIEEGFIDEVKELLKIYPSDLYCFNSIGYKEIISYLNGEMDLNTCIQEIKTHTHQYAKKQRTFLRNQFPNLYKGTKDDIFSLISYDQELKKRTSPLLTPKMKEKIESSKILLAGLGGVGSIVFSSLLRSGVLDITIYDKDKVEVSNLNRQILYDKDDIGLNKVDVASNKAKKLNPLTEVNAFYKDIKEINDLTDVKQDVIIDCIDYVPGKIALYLKAKKDNALYITSMGLALHLDSTKVEYSTLKYACDPLAKKFKEGLKEKGISESEIDSILIVHAVDARKKRKEKFLSSIVTVPNSGGLAIISLLLKKMEEL